MKEATTSEYLLARKTAEEYRRKGYDVSVGPLLDFLPGFRADLLVRKGGKVKVIEVKSRSSLATEPRIGELVQIIDSKPGWDFELLLVGEPERLDSPEGAHSFKGESILHLIEDAEKSLEMGIREAALLLAWSALEAVIRETMAAEGVSKTGITVPSQFLDHALFHSVISRAEYENLTSVRKYRNAIAHGFNARDFDDGLVKELIETVRRIATTSSLSNDEDTDQPSGT